MRQGQQNRRGRGRNNNNNNNNHRKNQNPMTRSFESAGPDIKIRGNPSHIAEKYMSLARDAQSSGDPVLAENYLQHAEHYNRIILTYREQQMSQNGHDGNPGGANRPHLGGGGDANNDDFAGDSDEAGASGYDQSGDSPQPGMHARNGQDRGGQDRGGQDHRGQRFHPSRGDRRRGRDDRGGPERDRGPDRAERSSEQSRAPAAVAGDEDSSNEQPAFLRRPIRRTRRGDGDGNETSGNPEKLVAAASAAGGEDND